jgi:hypothetical protein
MSQEAFSHDRGNVRNLLKTGNWGRFRLDSHWGQAYVGENIGEVIVRDILRTSLIGLLTACLIQIPAWGSPSRSLGIVVQSHHGRLGATDALSGATIFAGDVAETDAAGSLRLSLGKSQLYLPASSALKLEDPAGGVIATILRGTVNFASTASDTIAIRALDAVIRPATTKPTHGQVTVLDPNSLLVTSYLGPLAIEFDGELYAVNPGTTYRVLLSADPQEPQGEGAPQANHRRKLILLLVAVGAAAGAAILAYEGSKNRVALHPSSSRP